MERGRFKKSLVKTVFLQRCGSPGLRACSRCSPSLTCANTGRQAGGGSCTDTLWGLQEHDGNLAERLKDCKHLLIALLLQQLCRRSLESSGMLLPPAPSLPELWKWRSRVWTQSCRPLIPLPRGEDGGERECEKETRRYAGQKERIFYFQLLLGLSPLPCAPLPPIALLCPLLFLSLGTDGLFVPCVGTGFKCESTVSF